MISNTQRMRDFAAKLLGATRIDKRAQLYELPDHKTVLFRTSNERSLMGDGSLFVRNPNFIAIIMPKEMNNIDSGINVYLMPTDVVRQARDTGHFDWLATNPNTNGTDIEILYFDQRSDLPNSLQDYANKWKEYLLPNCRLVECPGFRIVSDQVLMTSTTQRGLVELLRHQAMTWSPSTSVEDYMQQVVDRIHSLEPWDQVRCDSVEHFLDDMMATGKISEYIKREYEWITL